jgi:predicted ArsR family transcriptional regulator
MAPDAAAGGAGLPPAVPGQVAAGQRQQRHGPAGPVTAAPVTTDPVTARSLTHPATATMVTVGSGAPGSERGTRGRIARLIMENGPVTAAGLSARLGLTPAAVRRHLDNLEADGLIETPPARSRASRRGRGRPARLFAITDAGRCAFEHAYDDLAASALRYLAERAGSDAIAEFARRQVADLERRYAGAVESASPGERVQALAEALSADGYAASASGAPAAGGEQLCQHHCPVAHVAAEYPQLCEAETEAFGRLLGTPVQRLATIANGDGICTTHVTAPRLALREGGQQAYARAAGRGQPPAPPQPSAAAQPGSQKNSPTMQTPTMTSESGGTSA